MNAVIGMTDLLMETDLNEQQREFLETVRSSGDALLAVINDILDFSKIESGEMDLDSAPFDLRHEIEGCLDMVVPAATSKGLELVCSLEPSCAHGVVGDVVRLRQIVVNLLANAVKFTERGEVLLEVDCEPTPDARLKVRIRVTDSGIGMTDETVARLFKSFSQARRVHDAPVRRNGTRPGHLQTSGREHAGLRRGHERGGGRFGLHRNCRAGPRTGGHRAPAHSKGSPGSPGSRSCLSTTTRPTYESSISSSPASACCATTTDDPLAAVDLVRGGGRYDIALLDMHMPRMDGVQLGDHAAHSSGHR